MGGEEQKTQKLGHTYRLQCTCIEKFAFNDEKQLAHEARLRMTKFVDDQFMPMKPPDN